MLKKLLLLSLAVTLGVESADRPAFIPSDATSVAPCVEALGDVYWNPAKPLGPSYGAFQGKPIFQEFMIPQKDFDRGVNLQDLKVQIHGYPIDHMDIWFAPHGHPGATMAHYDVIFFFVPHAEHMHICNPSGKLPGFVLQPL